MGSAGTILIYFVINWGLWQVLEGRIYDNEIETTRHIKLNRLMEHSFGFLEDGEIQFTMSCTEKEDHDMPEFWLLFCSSSDAREFTRLTDQQLGMDCRRLLQTDESFVSNKAIAYCKRHRVVENITLAQDQYTFSYKMDPKFYTMILLQCAKFNNERAENLTKLSNTRCQSVLLCVNPGNVHLSSDEIPLPVIFAIVSLFYATMVGAWFFNWVIYFKFSNRLHQLISCAPIFKVILVVLVLLWWQEVANTGLEPSDISSIRVFVQSIEDSLLFVTMMIIAEGWGVIRTQIRHYRWTSLILLFLLFATSLMCVHWVHRYFLAFSVCCLVFIMYKTLKWTSHNIDLLRRRRRKIRRFISRHNLRYKGMITLDMQVIQKLYIYKLFRVVSATFSLLYTIAITLATFLQDNTDIKSLTFEIPKLLVYVAIGTIFRLRNFEPYESIELVPPKENVVVIELPDVCMGQVDPHVTMGIPLHFKVEKETQTPRRRWRAPIM